MSSDSSQNGPPSSSSRNPPPSSRLTTRSALASFTSPSFPEPTPPSLKRPRSKFNIYEFEAPQFYDFTKQSDPERGHSDENWFDMRKRTPSSPDFHYIARTSSSLSATCRPKSASSKLCQKSNYSGSNGGFSFLNTPIGKGQTFLIPSSVKSSSSYKPRAALKKSATTENVTNYLLTSDSSDPPSTIIKSCQKKFKEFGSDERKIISGFLSTPLLVIKTPGNSLKDLPRSPLQKVTTKKSNLGLFSEGSSFLARETSSVESTNETLVIEETLKEQSSNNADSSKVINTDSSNVINAEGSNVINSSNTVNADSSNIIIPNTSLTSTTSTTSINSITQTILNSRKEREHESFQATVKARILEEREKIESQAAFQARKLQKLKAGPTSLPVKSTKPLTVPIGFQLGCDERAQLKKLQSKSQVTKPPTMALKVIKPTISQKFTPTIPKSPLFASKLRAAAKADKEKENAQEKEKENIMDNTTKSALDLRKKLEYRPVTTINRNRILNTSNASNNNSNKN